MKKYPTVLATIPLPSAQKGVVLLESLIGILVFSLGLLALTGLQAAMIKNTDDAKYRAEAAFVAQQKLSEVWLNVDGNNQIAGYNEGNLAVPQLPGGSMDVEVAPDNSCLVTVTVNWQLPGGAEHTYFANGTVQGANDNWCT